MKWEAADGQSSGFVGSTNDLMYDLKRSCSNCHQIQLLSTSTVVVSIENVLMSFILQDHCAFGNNPLELHKLELELEFSLNCVIVHSLVYF